MLGNPCRDLGRDKTSWPLGIIEGFSIFLPVCLSLTGGRARAPPSVAEPARGKRRRAEARQTPDVATPDIPITPRSRGTCNTSHASLHRQLLARNTAGRSVGRSYARSFADSTPEDSRRGFCELPLNSKPGSSIRNGNHRFATALLYSDVSRAGSFPLGSSFSRRGEGRVTSSRDYRREDVDRLRFDSNSTPIRFNSALIRL